MNLHIEWSWMHQQLDRFPAAAVELAKREIEVIVAQTQAAALAGKDATKTIPIVFVGVRDPVAAGLVESINRPGGNVTGVTLTASWELPAKQVSLLRDLIPSLSRLAIFHNPAVPVQNQAIEEIKRAIGPRGVVDRPIGIRQPGDIEAAFQTINRERLEGAMTLVDSFSLEQRELVAKLAIEYRVPTSFEVKEYVQSGVLLSYGLSYQDHYARAGTYVYRVLQGVQPRDLPVEQPTKFEFVINLKTAKALGLTVPDRLLALADEVIE